MVGRIQKSAPVVVFIAALCISISGPAIAAPPAGFSVGEERPQSAAPSLQNAENDSTDNSTGHHVNPSNATEEGDLLQVRGWLTGQLGDQLNRSAVTISQGQYEQGRSLLGDQYDSRLGQLVDVAGETESAEDDTIGDRFADARRTQRNFSDTAGEYEETYEAYQEAVENGNETGARRHARQLRDLENRLQRLNRSLGENYEELGNRTGTDFTRATASLSNLSKNVSSRQSRIEETTFTPTTLQVASDSERISYEDPLIASGQLMAEDNAPLSDREITLRVGEQTKRVQTDSDGRFSLRYHPRLIPVTSSQLSIRYIPRNDSQYLGSNASLAVTVEQVEANLAITSVPSSTSFGDRFEVGTSVTRNGEPLSGVPIEASLGDTQLTEQWTGNDGSGVLHANISASVPSGQQQLTVSMAAEDRAVSVTPVSAGVSVRPTNTTLSVRGERVGENQVRISGELATSEGLAVPEQTVQISISESIERSVETDQNGTYALSVSRAELPEETNASVFVTAVFGGQGTNLESVSTTERLTFESLLADNSQSGDGGFDLSALVVVALAGGVLLVLSWRHYRSSGSNGRGIDQATTKEAVENTEELETLDLSHGQSLADERPEAAVLWAYQNVREYLAGLTGAEDSDTHWEFYTKCQQQNLDEAQLSKLQDLVVAYETVRFHRSETDIDVHSIIADLEAERWSESPTGNSAD